MSKVVILDYQLGNLFSVERAMHNAGLETVVSSAKEDIANADALALPGMGAFSDAMESLHRLDLIAPIKDYVASGKPFLGICLGMQLLFSESEEFGHSKGLDLISGSVLRFNKVDSEGRRMRVPQIAWNGIHQPAGRSWKDTPLENVPDGADMYFVHSYYVSPTDDSVTLARAKYHDTDYTASVLTKNIFACQFHPEKSAQTGLSIYQRWATLNNLIPTQETSIAL